MKKIVPGGYYSFDAAGKKIWLDYSYYAVGLENIDRIRNLSKNLDLYSSSGAGKPISVSNGCITHSYPGTEADADKIQVTLKTPITNSLTELTPVDGVVTLETDGKVLVLPTANAAILPSFNQSVLDSNRLTIAESPFGGLKGSGSPDYAPGTLFCQTDGVYLTDTSGTNSTKTLTAGKLKELSLLTVDTTAHTMETIFQVENTGASNSPTVIDSCDSVTGWAPLYGDNVQISVESGKIKVVGTISQAGTLHVTLTKNINLSSFSFLAFEMQSSQSLQIRCSIKNSDTVYKMWAADNRFIVTSANTTFVLPLDAPLGTSGSLPTHTLGTFSKSTVTSLVFGVYGVPGSAATFYIDSITADTAKSAYIELQTPDNLADSSLTLQAWDGSAYQTTGTYKLDSTYSAVSTTTANWKLADGTKFDDCYGSGNGRALFPKGISAETKAGSTGNITYSANKGTSKRIGFRVDLPPSDGGRTNFNKCRMKAILSYAPDAENDYSASFDFADSTNTSYGLQNLSKPWIALYDPADSLIDFYLFTHRPQNLQFKRDETGTIYSLSLYPGAGSVYHGQIAYTGLTTDSDSNNIPDCLEASINGSVTKFLANYTMVI